uniref:Uncharacterized protein n=1 Tax=Corethron hystrix TaxID=216773 RepID=A0A6U5M4T2_9STRA|mmetsp:Transcript_8513/g.18755  ORF Transcript_8513/g.18755 Transcript_8513/m.18755 type:complete len:603 (+) Transcript_8513:281-2089(+)
MAVQIFKNKSKMQTCSKAEEKKYSYSSVSGKGDSRLTFSWKAMILNEFKPDKSDKETRSNVAVPANDCILNDPTVRHQKAAGSASFVLSTAGSIIAPKADAEPRVVSNNLSTIGKTNELFSTRGGSLPLRASDFESFEGASTFDNNISMIGSFSVATLNRGAEFVSNHSFISGDNISGPSSFIEKEYALPQEGGNWNRTDDEEITGWKRVDINDQTRNNKLDDEANNSNLDSKEIFVPDKVEVNPSKSTVMSSNPLSCLYEGSYLLLDDDCATIPEELSEDVMDEDDLEESETDCGVMDMTHHNLLIQLKNARLALESKNAEIDACRQEIKALNLQNVELEKSFACTSVSFRGVEDCEEKKSQESRFSQEIQSLTLQLQRKDVTFHDAKDSFGSILQDKDTELRKIHSESVDFENLANKVPDLIMQLDEARLIIEKNTTKLLASQKELDSLRSEKMSWVNKETVHKNFKQYENDGTLRQCFDGTLYAGISETLSDVSAKESSDIVGFQSNLKNKVNSNEALIAKIPDGNLGIDCTEKSKNIDVISKGEFLRHIHSLALHLKRSEDNRADLLEKIIKERRSNAKSLKRLQDIVKLLHSQSHET